ncbi:MAG: PAS domain-containing sensor histidine kinase, partial [Pseudorhodoplanes sp.]
MASADQSLPLERPAALGSGRRLPWRWIGLVAVGVALLSALATFLVLSGLTPLPPTHNVVVSLLAINGAAALVLVAVIAREIRQIVLARRHGRAGARLHVRIVGLFAIIAAVPTILVATVATITLDRGLDRFFSSRTKAIIENSLLVAEAYLREHGQLIRGDILAMAQDVTRAKPLFDSERERFRQFLSAQATIRGLPVAVILTGDLEIVERTNLRVTQDFAIPNKEVLKAI